MIKQHHYNAENKCPQKWNTDIANIFGEAYGCGNGDGECEGACEYFPLEY